MSEDVVDQSDLSSFTTLKQDQQQLPQSQSSSPLSSLTSTILTRREDMERDPSPTLNDSNDYFLWSGVDIVGDRIVGLNFISFRLSHISISSLTQLSHLKTLVFNRGLLIEDLYDESNKREMKEEEEEEKENGRRRKISLFGLIGKSCSHLTNLQLTISKIPDLKFISPSSSIIEYPSSQIPSHNEESDIQYEEMGFLDDLRFFKQLRILKIANKTNSGFDIIFSFIFPYIGKIAIFDSSSKGIFCCYFLI